VETSILILNFRAANFCKKLLQSIKKFSPTSEFEIILIDNFSGKNEFHKLKKICEKFPENFSARISIFQTKKNRGFAAGVNFGLKKCRGEFIALLNPDIEILQLRTFEKLIQFLRENPRAAAVGPRLIFPNGKTQDSFRRFPSISDLAIKRIPFLRKIFAARLRKFLLWEIDFSRPVAVDWLVGAFLVFRKKTAEKIGNFDERFFLFFEDTDFCRRLREKNWEIFFVPHFSARHAETRLSETQKWWKIFITKMGRVHLFSAVKYFLKFTRRKI
jgi:hypothetical protein